jgi:hypothetical protein
MDWIGWIRDAVGAALLDQLYILGVAGGLILQMVAVLQANQRAELSANENENARSSYNSIARQRLGARFGIVTMRYSLDEISASANGLTGAAIRVRRLCPGGRPVPECEGTGAAPAVAGQAACMSAAGSGADPNNRHRHRQAGGEGAENRQSERGKQICLRAHVV